MEKIEYLQRSHLFDNLLPAELELLAELTQVQRMGVDEKVFEEGDVGDALFVIAEGEVEVTSRNARGEDKRLAQLKAPEFFGEMSLIDKAHRSATVYTRADSVLLRLSNDNIHTFAKVHRDGFTWLAVNIARVLSQRLRQTNRRLKERS
jgi:CRP/FNR family cyclic AMP-dependent transcriptional regulator